ncbi:hypothetical protein GQ53DRAFT_753586 [Thozetella sp. PMI_491]|nr:hypothetical protein GQ53DRAFT_753586 [Thozetella sp. PMI_491]
MAHLEPSDHGFSQYHVSRILALPEEYHGSEFAALHERIKEQLQQNRDAQVVMPPEDYLDGLAKLDLTDPYAVAAFVSRTSLGMVDPVPLGSHGAYDYVLNVCTDTVPPTDNTTAMWLDDRMAQLSPAFVSYQRLAIPGAAMVGAPDLRFGVGLGFLAHRPTGSAATDQYNKSGFYVLLSATDKSLWVTGKWDATDDCSFSLSDDVNPSDWGRLPGDARLRIGTMRISQPSWETTADHKIARGSDPFSTWPPLACWLKSQPANQSEIDAAQTRVQARVQAGR